MLVFLIIPGAIVVSFVVADSRVLRGDWPTLPPPPCPYRAAAILACVLGAALLDKALGGVTYNGPVTPRGHKPTYKDNALTHAAVATFTFFAGAWVGLWKLQCLLSDFEVTVSSLNVLGLAACTLLYAKGRLCPSGLDTRRPTSFAHDFYWGLELFPKAYGIDIKRLCNCRVSMTFWMLHGISAVALSYEMHGEVDAALIALALLQYVYLLKFFAWERGYMASLDITMDHAGFYLIWGVSVFVPTVYTAHTRIAVINRSVLSPVTVACLFCIALVSTALNFQVDLQRYRFRKAWNEMPSAKRAAEDDDNFIRAPFFVKGEGGKVGKESALLLAGWWGRCRHPQYLFELAIAWSWCGLAHSNFGLNYIYAVVLTVILLHRIERDEQKCTAKYGAAYTEKYCARVPNRLLPSFG